MSSVANASLSWLCLLLCQSIRPGRFWRQPLAFVQSLVLFGAFAFSEQSLAVQVIANASVPAAQTSLKELRAIYTMRMQRWENGEEIQVFVLPHDHPAHQKFCKSLLQVLPHQLQAVWYRLVYSGMGRAPIEVQSEQEMIERVRRTPGAIGYLEHEHEVQDEKILQIRP